MVRAQMLSELEEIIQYKQYADQPERQASMRRTWMKRFEPQSDPRIAILMQHADFKGANRMSKFGNVSSK